MHVTCVGMGYAQAAYFGSVKQKRHAKGVQNSRKRESDETQRKCVSEQIHMNVPEILCSLTREIYAHASEHSRSRGCPFTR